MKSLKSKILFSLLTLCCAMVGVNQVKAEPFSLQNPKVVCEPNTVEAGKQTNCYLVGVPNGEGNSLSVNGYVTFAYTTDDLILIDALKNENIANTAVKYMDAEAATTTIDFNSSIMPSGLNGFQCVYDTNIPSGVDFGCAVFYTLAGKGNAFTPTSITTGNDTAILPAANYGVIGQYIVEADINSDGGKCGTLCLKSWRIESETDYAKHQDCQSDTSGGCTTTTPFETVSGNNGYICADVHVSSNLVVNPGSGAFASYALLAAGALLAVSALTLSQKNKKIFKV